MAACPTRLAEEKNEQRDSSELWKAVEMMLLQLKEEKGILEQRIKEQEEKMEAMAAKIKSLEGTCAKNKYIQKHNTVRSVI